MATNRKNSEVKTLEIYNYALVNSLSPEILEKFETAGYDAAKFAKGQKLFDAAEEAHSKAHRNKVLLDASYRKFSQVKAKLNEFYLVHRKKAKVIYKKDELMKDSLEISGRMPRTYIAWYDTIRSFYANTSKDKAIQKRLAKLRITPEELNEGLELIKALEDSRSKYFAQKGTTQNDNDQKDKIFARLDEWMSAYYTIARLVFADTPQQLEAFGVVVPSSRKPKRSV